MKRTAYVFGYVSAWIWDVEGRPLSMSFGDMLLLGGIVICCIASLNLLV